MGRPPGKPDYATAFGKALQEQLAGRAMRVADLSRAANLNATYLSRMMTGSKSVSPSTANLIADALSLNAAERMKIHTAAALDLGYEVKPPTDSSAT